MYKRNLTIKKIICPHNST